MRYKCLVFDHDDTVVDSTRNIHYPSFLEYNKIYHPEVKFSLEEYVLYNFDPGVIPFFRNMCGYSEEELKREQDFWQEFASHHVAEAFEGIREIMEKHKAAGGVIAVVSHSFSENILKDYRHNGLPEPDAVFGWEQPKEERKPSKVPLEKIMRQFDLEPSEMLVIDDLKPGLTMARAAGVPFAAAGWCFDIPENTLYMKQNADFYCETVKELAEIL